ncbi:MAG TPA: potassium/proton antiporter [Candidatus Fimivivens faecavium]|mgnify:CR=1 FL=1|nr:potassium/proton antiporter [Candidatus Fimivivens faecavium]
MTFAVFCCAVVLLICVASSKLSNRLGVPTLLLFLVLGMLFGSDGILKIPFEDYALAEQICSVALIFIMFYGGFGTNWSVAKPVAFPAILMSTAGVVVTAALTGVFCHFVLKMDLLEGLLVGAVIGSTDAASVFSILRSRNLNLRYGLASLLEIESGSNDPTAYMLTVVLLAMMANHGSQSIVSLIFTQVAFGLIFGFLIAFASVWLLRQVSFTMKGLHTIFVVAIALLSYSLPGLLGGNGYLSAYIAGIVIGNSKILHKVELVHFFDGITWLMQISLFFLLGLLSFPSQLPAILPTAVGIALFLTFVARPVATFLLLSWFRMPIRRQLLISWAGLRGAASIVFAIYTITSDAYTSNDIFHIVFCVALFSVAFQGTLLPKVAEVLGLVDHEETIFKTFTDYQDETDVQLLELTIDNNNIWVNQKLKELHLPKNLLIVMIKRGNDIIVPRGDTKILTGDTVVLNGIQPKDLEIALTPEQIKSSLR